MRNDEDSPVGKPDRHKTAELHIPIQHRGAYSTAYRGNKTYHRYSKLRCYFRHIAGVPVSDGLAYYRGAGLCVCARTDSAGHYTHRLSRPAGMRDNRPGPVERGCGLLLQGVEPYHRAVRDFGRVVYGVQVPMRQDRHKDGPGME